MRIEADISRLIACFRAKQWAALRDDTPMTLTQSEIVHLQLAATTNCST
jgi:pantothenate kinase